MPYTDTGRISLFHETSGAGGPPLLLIHELGGSSESWWRFLPLAARTRRTVAVDLRGAGRSEKPPGAFELADQADDLAASIGAAFGPGPVDVIGPGPVDVIGSALGALVAALLAIRHPDAVRRLVLCAVAPEMAGRTADYVSVRAERVRRVGMRDMADTSLLNAFPSPHEDARAAYRSIYLANDPAAYAEMSLALARLRLTPADWGAIRRPALVLSGAHDFIWPPDEGRRVAALIPGARFDVLPNAGHFPHMQTPEDLHRRVMDFLDHPAERTGALRRIPPTLGLP
jgi:3-oxoadipate enol-lactonase